MWVGYLTTIGPLVVIPGASLTLLVHRVTAYGRRQAVPVIAGTVTAMAVYASVVLAGMSLPVAPSVPVDAVLRVTGGVYLVGLGCWTWRSARAEAPVGDEPGPPARPRRSGYVQALLSTLLNPKAALIYLTIVPRFVDPSHARPGQLLMLTAAHAAATTCWLLLWTVLVGAAVRLTGSWRARITRACAVVLVVIGVRWVVA